MTRDHVRALELWLSAQPIGDEPNEMVPVSIMSITATSPDPTKEFSDDQHL